jgi:hypothetical protein
MNSPFAINCDFAKEITDQYKAALQRELRRTQDILIRELLERLLELDAKKLEGVLEASFFASLEAEEGRTHGFLIAVAPPITAISRSVANRLPPHVFADYYFEKSLDIDRLPKVAPALATTEQRIGVWFEGAAAKIWGFASMSTLLTASLQIKTFGPGRLVISDPLSVPNGLFLLSSERAESISGGLSLAALLFDEDDLKKRASPDHLTSLRYSGRIPRRTRLLKDIANGMRDHAHGGTLLVVPDKVLDDSISQPITLLPARSFDFIRRKLEKEEDESLYAYQRQVSNRSLPWSFNSEARFLARSTSADGATIITKDFDLLAFGIKIKRKSRDAPEQVFVREPFRESQKTIDLSDFGGTRHQSAAQFVFDNREAFAITASQDGVLSVVSWDPTRKMVSAFRHAEYLFSTFD